MFNLVKPIGLPEPVVAGIANLLTQCDSERIKLRGASWSKQTYLRHNQHELSEFTAWFDQQDQHTQQEVMKLIERS